MARRLGKGIWRMDEHMRHLREKVEKGEMKPEAYRLLAALVPRIHRQEELLENRLSATFSRALKRLEARGLVERFQKTGVERWDGRLYHFFYKVKAPPRRARTVRVRLAPGEEGQDEAWT